MAIAPLAVVNGIGALLVVLSGYFMAGRLLLYYTKEKKRLQPIVALMGFSMGNLFLGGAVSFLYLLFSNGENNITGLTASYLIAPFIPIGITCGMFLGFDLFNPKKVKIVIPIYIATAVVFYIAFFGFTEQMVKVGEVVPGELADNNFKGLVLYMVLFYIGSILLFVCPGFYNLRKRIPAGAEKNKITELFLGFTLFALGCVIDATLTETVIIVGRMMLVVAMVFLYRGFNH